MSKRTVILCTLALVVLAIVLGTTVLSNETKTTHVAGGAKLEAKCPAGQIFVTERNECLSVAAPGSEGSGVKPEGYEQVSLNAAPRGAHAGVFYQIDRRGLLLLENEEGFIGCPYWDPYGHVSTRGFGETDFFDTFGHRCVSRRQGEANLRNLMNNNYLVPVRHIGGTFNQCQVDAMGDASYNLGTGIIYSHASQWVRHEAYWLLAYDHAGGQVLSGLARRRRTEVALFYSHSCAPIKPKPLTRAQKRAHAEHMRNVFGVLLLRHHCFTKHGPHANHKCPTEGRLWRHYRAEARRLK